MNSKKLKQIMEKRGISQYQMAKDSGISLSSVHWAYHGIKVNQPSRTIRAFEKALNLKKGELL